MALLGRARHERRVARPSRRPAFVRELAVRRAASCNVQGGRRPDVARSDRASFRLAAGRAADFAILPAMLAEADAAQRLTLPAEAAAGGLLGRARVPEAPAGSTLTATRATPSDPALDTAFGG
jgi:hypothetical protein